MKSSLRAAAVALVGLLAVGLPAAAHASEVHVAGNTVVYTAAPGEANNASVQLSQLEGDANRYYVQDAVTITVGPGCSKDEFYDLVNCQMPGPSPVLVDLGDNNDVADVGPAGTVRGGDGNDKLVGGTVNGPQTLDGGPGDDQLSGDPASGCKGGVQVTASPDNLIGGAGVDTVVYDRYVPGFTVSLDDQANDGITGANEGDNAHSDIENVSLPAYCADNNVITGSAGPNHLSASGTLNGLGGDDVLDGSGDTNDVLNGGDGNDTLKAFGGNDKLDGGAGNDFLEGGFDDDLLIGGPGTDSLVGDETASNTIGTGNDTIMANDGIGENVSCGPGTDVADLDALDKVPVDTQNLCETIKRAPAGGGGGTTPAKRLVVLSGLKLTSKNTVVRATIACAATDKAGCNGTVRLLATRTVRKNGKLVKTKVTIASRVISLAPKRKLAANLALNATGRALVKQSRKLPVTATTKLRTSGGVKTVTQALILRR